MYDTLFNPEIKMGLMPTKRKIYIREIKFLKEQVKTVIKYNDKYAYNCYKKEIKILQNEIKEMYDTRKFYL